MYSRLIEASSDELAVCRNLRLFVSGSAPLSVDLMARFENISGHRILERYGMTETGINATNPVVGERIPASVGMPLAGVEIRIAGNDGTILGADEKGIVQIRGTSLFSGYWNLPEATAESMTPDGWFITGDIGRMDRNGYLFLVGRLKDTVITGGYNVYPVEIEAALERLPEVREASVIGAPHPDFGEGVVAIVVAENGYDISESKILAELKQELAPYKVPKRILSVRSLPRNAMGKIIKNELRDAYSGVF